MPNSPILIVDDEPQNLAALDLILSGSYGLVFARNGAEAFAAVQKHKPWTFLKISTRLFHLDLRTSNLLSWSNPKAFPYT